VAIVAPVLLVAGCGGNGVKAGADAAAAGPHYSAAAPASPRIAASSPAPAPSAPTASPSADTMAPLRARAVEALGADDPIAASTLIVQQRPFAGNQLVFTWTASDDPADPEAKARVRAQALTLLQQARRSGLSYGSVLLSANAVVRDATGRKTEVVAVRAKYTRALVLRTDFTKVSPADVFKLPDDKPAQLDPHFA
jgi:hypothetical protein